MKRLIAVLTVTVLLAGVLPVKALGAGPGVDAKSAVLMEVSTGTVLCAQNENAPLPPASVTKVMTLLLVMEALDNGQLGLTDSVTASEAAAAKGGSQVFLKVGEVMSVDHMLKAVAVSSANDCACALAEYIAGSEAAFVEKMNARAAELGMKDTHFVNCTGLDDGADAKDHRTSAYDIALMSRELLQNHPRIREYTTIWMDTLRDGAFGLSNTNKLIRFYPGATGLKTGFTSGAGYCLSASAEREGMELVAVVMGCETSQKRFAACKSLLDYGFANYALASPEIPENMEVPVRLGTAAAVRAVPAEEGRMLIEKGQKASVNTQVELEAEVAAPVSKGARLGTLTVKAGEQILSQIPLVAQEAVPRMTFRDVVWQLLLKLTG